MRPRLPQHNHRDVLERDTKLVSQVLLTNATGSVSSSDLYHVGLGEFGDPSSRPVCSADPSLGIAVGRVVGGGSKEEMIWITTRRVVALMEYPQAIRNLAMGQRPSDTGSFPECSPKPDRAISTFKGSSLPVPAIIGAATVDFRPEAFLGIASKVVSDIALMGTVFLRTRIEDKKGGAAVETGPFNRGASRHAIAMRRAATLRTVFTKAALDIASVGKKLCSAIQAGTGGFCRTATVGAFARTESSASSKYCTGLDVESSFAIFANALDRSRLGRHVGGPITDMSRLGMSNHRRGFSYPNYTRKPHGFGVLAGLSS